MPGPRHTYLSLGSNLGDRVAHLEAGLIGLAEVRVTPVRCSPVYRTAPVGGPQQGDFLNLVIQVETSLDPRGILGAALAVERARGRVRRRSTRWGPRTLDVDLLLSGDRVIDEEGLELPHPRMHLRRFVLVPLADIAPEAIHPTSGLRIRELLETCPDECDVALEAPPLPVPAPVA